jgi:DNA-directed RNA polymerase specialized sigma24 family protein
MVDHDHLIHAAIRRNRTLLYALRLETEDVYQELAMAMLKAIDSFDPSRSHSLGAHINAKLKYAILDLKKNHKPGGVTGSMGQRISVTSVDSYYDDGSALELEDSVSDYFGNADISDALATLTEPERKTLCKSLYGDKPRTRDQRSLLDSAREKIMSFYHGDELLVASW